MFKSIVKSHVSNIYNRHFYSKVSYQYSLFNEMLIVLRCNTTHLHFQVVE